jgi:peptide/nickel transport system permease protein
MGRALQHLRGAPKIPTLILTLTLVAAVFGEQLAPHSATAVDPRNGERPPAFVRGGTWDFPLGTDRLGRDVLSRLVVGTRYSLQVAAVVIAMGALVGVTLGSIAGFSGGWIDVLVMRLVDISLGFPAIVIALVLAASIGPGFWIVSLVIAFIAWPRFARQVRAEVLSIKEQDFVALARVAGASPFYTMVHHILPNILNSVVVVATLLIGWAIIVEATLSFLGVGIPLPTPTWGNMVSDGRTYVSTLWWISLFPGVAITLVSLGFNMFGDWLRDLLDPKLRNI